MTVFIQKEISNDDLTPILCFKAVGGLGSCILESDGKQGEGENSLIGIRPFATFQTFGNNIEIRVHKKKSFFTGDPYEALETFAKGRKAFGFIGYNAVQLQEKLPNRHTATGMPDFFFHLYQTVIVFDHDRKKILFTHEGSEEELDAIILECYKAPTVKLKPFTKNQSLEINPDLSREEYADLVVKAQEHIKAGDIFQVVLSRTFKIDVKASPFEIYRAIRQVSPAPYLFFFEEKEFAIAGASPELLISVKEGFIKSMPIAGTAFKENSILSLLENPKECAEHVMLVDLARNDVGSVATIGSVRVSEYKKVHSFSHVHHIVSKIEAQLTPSLKPLEALKRSLPAGTLSGAPKIRAMEIIDALENTSRGLYGGAIVAIDEKGDFTSCIAIRMALIKDGTAEVRTGAGIVLDSDPMAEALETEGKAKGILEALKLAEGGTL